MDRERVYVFFHKLIRNIVPGKSLQRTLIEALRKSFFPVELQARYGTLDDLEARGNAETRKLCAAAVTPGSTLCSVQEEFPARLHEEARDHPALLAFSFAHGGCFRNFVLDEQDNFLKDATRSSLWGNLYRNNASIRSLKPRRINADVLALVSSHTDNYYHWFADLIGPLLLFPDRKKFHIYTDLRYPYQKEIFALLGIPPSRLLPLTSYGFLRCARLTVIKPAELAHPASLRQLQELAEKTAGAERARRRLFISRADTIQRRGIRNEKELLPILRDFGFERMIFSGLPVAEQIRCLQQAEYVVFPQGAAVLTMAFCKPGTKFLEVYSPLLPDTTGVRISTALGLEHHVLEGVAPQDVQDPQSPYCLDPDIFRKALDRLTA